MPNFHGYLWKLIIIILVFTFGIVDAGEIIKTKNATVVEIEGKVKIKRSTSNRWVSAIKGTTLQKADQIKTSPQAYCLLVLWEGSTVKMGENTHLEIMSLKEKSDSNISKIKIFAGKIWNNVSKVLNKKTDFEVESPYTLAAVKGTVFEVSCEPKQDDLMVFDGTVAVKALNDKKSNFIDVTKDYQIQCYKRGFKKRIPWKIKKINQWQKWNMAFDRKVYRYLKNKGIKRGYMRPGQVIFVRQAVRRTFRKNPRPFLNRKNIYHRRYIYRSRKKYYRHRRRRIHRSNVRRRRVRRNVRRRQHRIKKQRQYQDNRRRKK